MDLHTLIEVFGNIVFRFTRSVSETFSPEDPYYSQEYIPLENSGLEWYAKPIEPIIYQEYSDKEATVDDFLPQSCKVRAVILDAFLFRPYQLLGVKAKLLLAGIFMYVLDILCQVIFQALETTKPFPPNSTKEHIIGYCLFLMGELLQIYFLMSHLRPLLPSKRQKCIFLMQLFGYRQKRRGDPRASLFPKFKMEESDEDVDVEDISDGEQISHLRYGTGGDQKNSWYDKEMGSQSLLASSSCSFSSDYCDTNSWLLDPNTVHCDSCFIDLLMLISKFDDWSLDNCTDEKSREVIEKMILEEQYPLTSKDIKIYSLK
ncbi:hypothetical protein P5673_021160 [Acropora cervicornis]|uniref:Uncharacterized protein n=1 Tax=Acropora cervicornis TaxID=6130 RepID=A0AAD9Q8C4_ACRCE|nr:hypothetical protein P5673_021160 [Acropora cervicornis]